MRLVGEEQAIICGLPSLWTSLAAPVGGSQRGKGAHAHMAVGDGAQNHHGIPPWSRCPPAPSGTQRHARLAPVAPCISCRHDNSGVHPRLKLNTRLILPPDHAPLGPSQTDLSAIVLNTSSSDYPL